MFSNIDYIGEINTSKAFFKILQLSGRKIFQMLAVPQQSLQ
jgi:hypothetical protein